MTKIKRLFFFPEAPNNFNGYGIAVSEDLKKFVFSDSDLIVFYTDKLKGDIEKYIKLPGQVVVIKRNKNLMKLFKSRFRILNPGRFWDNEVLNTVSNNEIEYIFCGDTIFYEFIHLFFADKSSKIAIRFHNNWHKIKSRIRLLKVKVNLKFYITNLLIDIRTERKAFLNRKADKYFISTSDLAYYRLITGNRDGQVWGVTEFSDAEVSGLGAADKNISNSFDVAANALRHKRFIWFGTVVAHSVDGVNRFISDIFKPLQSEYPSLEFHLYGYGTEAFNSTVNNIYAHGIYKGDSLPMKNEGLYILPDLTGGGIKLKVNSFIVNEVCFLSTPFGVEGYSIDKLSRIADVVEFDLWEEHLKAKLRNS